jgi:two-component system, chemotaxis family, CheB/CheR fusion protein
VSESASSQQNAQAQLPGTGRSSNGSWIVGIGASAGGLKALQQFFQRMRNDSGLAFVIILHLSPEHESNLAGLIQYHTAMPVTQVTEPTRVEPNHIYVIPPSSHLALADGMLRLSKPQRLLGQHVTIDLFFRTLAETHGSNAAAVVLSGTGADGANGLKRVKELGGVTIVQDPQDAEYDSMPRNAIATGLVDYVLPVAAMPDQLLTYIGNSQQLRLPATDRDPPSDQNEILREVFVLMRVRTGHDFSNYKRATMLRRIGRRMQVNSIVDLAQYMLTLRERPGEVEALLRDLLISVTNFYRDPAAFAALEANLPRLFTTKLVGDHVRVWVAGCATGEETYSVAMLLREYADRLERPPAIQIFATDIDEGAISFAREGRYSENITADVSPERLMLFFTQEQGFYRVKKEIRDMVLFAVHNLLRDPPFSRLDIVTCRNVLIYLDRDVQQQLFKLFHFVLRPEGMLLLGASEFADGVPNLFGPIDKHNRLFVRHSAPRATASLPVLPLSRQRLVTHEHTEAGPAGPSFGELHLHMLEQYAPPSVLVNQDYDIVHLSESAGQFLQFGGGEPSFNLLNLVHPDLRIELRTALFRAIQHGRGSESTRSPIQIDGTTRWINLVVRPAQDQQSTQTLVLVIFDESEPDVLLPEPVPAEEQDPLAHQLEQELQHTKNQLRSTIEQYETSIEELKASNEELQAINEELHSTAEELETSKEELQSTNEELHAVNQELKNKIDELSRVNADLQNFLAATDIGTIFLDRALRIVRYTPQVGQLFNLIPSDIQRPLAHITHRILYTNLPGDAAQVLDRLIIIEREVQHDDGRWYVVRLLPYRTIDDHIDGVVLTFVDVTQRRFAEEARLDAHRQTELILENISDAYLSIDRDWCGVYVNQAAEQLLRVQRAQIIGKDIRQVYAGADIAAFFGQFQQVMDEHTTLIFDAYHRSARIWVEMRVFPTADGGIAIYQRDNTERKILEQHWRASEERLRLMNENIHDYAITLLDTDGRLIDWNAGAERMFGYTAAEALGQPSAILFTPEDRMAGVPEHELITARDKGRADDERWHLRKDGSRFWVSGVMTPLRDEDGQLRGFAKVARDLTEHMQAEEVLRRAHDDLEQRVQQRTTDLAAANLALQGEIVKHGQAQLARDQVMRQLITAEELQRQRLSRELHDQIGQQLTALLLGLESLKQSSRGRPKSLAIIEQLHNIADQIGREVHQLALDLRPTALDDLGLAAALANYSANWSQRAQVVVNFHSSGLDTLRPPPEIETTIYRVVLEALNNVARHARAKHVSIILERRSSHVAAIIEDDGQGFDTEAVVSRLRQEHRLGLLGMRERLAQLGGMLTVESTLGSSTTVIARIPLHAPQEGTADG